MTKNRYLYALLADALLWPRIGAGEGASSLPRTAPQAATPEQEAIELFNDGISDRDKAEKLEREAATEADAKKKAKLEKKAVDKHEISIRKFAEATRKNPRLFQAWGSLGYAYRKTGKYPESLGAYDTALQIEPSYTPAIEYRGEAYLALDRLDDVKTSYMTLFRTDRVRADALAAAIDQWLQKKRAEPGTLDPSIVESFATWAAERKQLASQTSSLLAPQPQRW